MAGAAGQVLGDRYRLVERVATGGRGQVWRGYDEVLQREVAVNGVVLAGLPGTELDALAFRAMRNAGATARLDHPGIAAAYDAVHCDGVLWIVTKFISGPSLAQVIGDQGRLAWRRIAALGADLAEALAHVHAAGMFHGRLNPGNVLLADGRAVLADFVMARVLEEIDLVTGTRSFPDVSPYMPPEQLKGEAVGPPGDMWALGATLYAGVEGCPPFTGELMEVAVGIVHQPIPAPGHAGPMASILHSLTTKAPGQRPSASVAAGLLRAAAVNEAGN
jgi:serine/threonine protein kinase